MKRCSWTACAMAMLISVGAMTRDANAKPVRVRQKVCGELKLDIDLERRKAMFELEQVASGRLTGLGSMLSGGLKRATNGSDIAELKRLQRVLETYEGRLNQMGYTAYVAQKGRVSLDKQEEEFIDYLLTGKGSGMVGQLRTVASVNIPVKIRKRGKVAEAYARAQVNVNKSVIPVVQVGAAGGITVFAGGHAPTQVPLMRVEAGTELVWLNKGLGVSREGIDYCRVLVIGRNEQPAIGWVACDPATGHARM